MNKRVCTSCNIEKEVTEFNKHPKGKFGVQPKCKVCKKKYRENNKEKIKELNKKWREKNKEYDKKWREKNKEYHKEYSKEWYENNKEKEKERSKEYREKNKEQLNKYQKQRRQIDPLFKLSGNIRNLISISLRKGGYKKNTKTANILGCPFEEFKVYIESQFERWMNWDNHGKYNGELNHGFDIDHIIPLCSAKTEEELIKLNHYTNLQPLCSKVNREIKRNKKDVKK